MKLTHLLLCFCLCAAQNVSYNVPFHSSQGQQLLVANSTLDASYFALAEAFTTQVTQTWCSLATAVTLLNALNATQHLPAPVGASYAPYGYFTQEDVFSNSCIPSVKTHTGEPFSAAFLAAHGATLDEWAAYMRCFASVSAVHANTSSVVAFRAALVAAMQPGSGVFMALNYLRTGVHQPGGGHMSPLAAYDSAGDRVLILDVARYRGLGPIWAPLTDVFAAMNTTDSDSRLSRGWVAVSAPAGAVLPPGPAYPPFNGTLGRACLAQLTAAQQNDVDAVERCMRSVVGGGSAAQAGARASGWLGAATFVLAVSTTALAWALWKAHRRAEGGALLPR
jgi:hypothetical protein